MWGTLGKHFLPPAGCGSIFLAKSYQDAWRSGSWLARGHMNMANEATFVQLWKYALCAMRSGAVMKKNWVLSVEQWTAGVAAFSACHLSAEHTSRMEWFLWNSESGNGSNWQQNIQLWSWHFLVQVWLWEMIWNFFSVQPLSWSLLAVL